MLYTCYKKVILYFSILLCCTPVTRKLYYILVFYYDVQESYVIDNKMAVCRPRRLTQCNQYTATASMC